MASKKGVVRPKEPAAAALMEAAVKLADTPPPAAKGYTVVKSVSEKQRPRRQGRFRRPRGSDF